MQGAAAYAKFYFDVLNRAFREGDTSTLDLLSTESCATCVALSQGVKDMKAKGRRYAGDLVKVNYASAMEFTPTKRQVLIDLTQDDVPIRDAAGKEVDRTNKASLMYVATLSFDQRWTMTRLQKASS